MSRPTHLTVGDADGLLAIRRWVRTYVDQGRLPGALTLVARAGRVELLDVCGMRDVQRGLAIEPDTLFRIHSMTKPVTSVAALLLVERGALHLDDPVAEFVPSFSGLAVNRKGVADAIDPESLRRPMTVRHLLTHTSGLTYGEGNPGAVSRLYREQRTDFDVTDGVLEQVVERLATIPLLFQPGESWNYGVSTDVLGRVVEVASGQTLDVFMREQIFGPLGMTDTSFAVGDAAAGRLAALYEVDADDQLVLVESADDSPYVRDVTTLSGGAGLVSTAHDYLRFAEVLRLGGSVDGVRLLDPSLVRSMTRNQLGDDLAAMGQPTFNETSTHGIGFGLGVSVVVDPARTTWPSSLGEFAWGGYASTAFWVDPVHDLTVVFLTQVMPSDHFAIRHELRALVRRAFTTSSSGLV
ncbi:MAG: serine hydrolase domain-containing protein [Actinomycetes bacterium]